MLIRGWLGSTISTLRPRLTDRRPSIKIPLDDEFSDLCPQLLDLGLPRGLLPLVVPREAGQHRLSSRLLPVGNQVRMQIVAGRQLRHRRFLAKHLQRDLRLQLSRITPSLPWHSRLLLLGLDPTLASCPNSGVHLCPPPAHGARSRRRSQHRHSAAQSCPHRHRWRQGPAVGLTSDGARARRDRRASRDHRPLMAR